MSTFCRGSCSPSLRLTTPRTNFTSNGCFSSLMMCSVGDFVNPAYFSLSCDAPAIAIANTQSSNLVFIYGLTFIAQGLLLYLIADQKNVRELAAISSSTDDNGTSLRWTENWPHSLAGGPANISSIEHSCCRNQVLVSGICDS